MNEGRKGTTYLALDIAARIKRARVELGEIRAGWRGCCAGDLWPTDCIRDNRRHRRFARTQIDDGVRIAKGTAILSPGVGVKAVNLSHRKAICGGDLGTVVVRLDGVGRTRAVRVRRGGKVRQRAGRAADVLARL